MGSMLDNRPAAAGGTLGMLLVGLLGVLVTQTSGAEIVDEGLEELPFTPGLMVALGSPEAEGNAVSSSLESASEPAESSEVAEPSETETETETETDDVQSRSPRPPRPGPSRPVGRPNPGPGPSSLPAAGAASSPDPFGSPSGFGDLEREGDP